MLQPTDQTTSPIHEGSPTNAVAEPPPPPPQRPSEITEQMQAQELAKMKEHLALLEGYLEKSKLKSKSRLSLKFFGQVSDNTPELLVTYASLPKSKSLKILVNHEEYSVQALKKLCNSNNWNNLCHAEGIKELFQKIGIAENDSDLNTKITEYKQKLEITPPESEMNTAKAFNLLLLLYIENNPQQAQVLLKKVYASPLSDSGPNEEVRKRREAIEALEKFKSAKDDERAQIDGCSTAKESYSYSILTANERAKDENAPTDSLIEMWRNAIDYAENGIPANQEPCQGICLVS